MTGGDLVTAAGALGLPLGAVLLGWVLGGIVARAATGLTGGSRGPSPQPARFGVAGVDPLLQGFQALVLGALAWRFGPSIQLAVYGALSLALTLVLFIDL